MVSPQQFASFQNLTYSVQFENVQDLLDQSAKENELARSAAKYGFDWTWFPTTGEVRTFLAEQKQKYPDVELFSIGRTVAGQEIEGIAFGRSGNNAPTIYMHCTIHAREWITTTTCMWIIDQLLATDPDRVHLLNQFRWIVVPIHNVDGYQYSHTADRLWRKNRQPNTGSTCIGTDLNRNYAYGWGGPGASTSPCAETYRGARAYSSPETIAEINYLQPYLDLGRVRAYIDIHSYGAYVLSAWGYTSMPPPDYTEMNRNMVSVVNTIRTINGRTYTYGPSGPTLYLTSGSTVDQLYGDSGVVNSYTIECFGSSFTPPASWIQPIGREVWAGIKQLATNLQKIVEL